MSRPTECKWCGCGDIERESPIMQSLIVTFACGTMSDTDASGTRWLRDQRCAGPVGKLYKRIRRAIDKLKAAKRYRVSPKTPKTIEWEETVDGIVTDSAAVDEVIAILEGEREIDDDTFFACGTSWCGRVDVWNQSTGCVEIMRSQRRIQRATKTLEDTNQMMMRLDDDEDVSWVVESQTVLHAIEILEIS